MKKIVLIIIGTIFLILGGIGIFIPVLPTTPFVLIASGCYAAGSQRLNNWLVESKFFGSFINNYRHKTGVPITHKLISITFLCVSISISIILIDLWFVDLILLIVGIGVTLHLVLLRTKKDYMKMENIDDNDNGTLESLNKEPHLFTNITEFSKQNIKEYFLKVVLINKLFLFSAIILIVGCAAILTFGILDKDIFLICFISILFVLTLVFLVVKEILNFNKFYNQLRETIKYSSKISCYNFYNDSIELIKDGNLSHNIEYSNFTHLLVTKNIFILSNKKDKAIFLDKKGFTDETRSDFLLFIKQKLFESKISANATKAAEKTAKAQSKKNKS